MSINGMSCELVDQGDLDTRYLAGTLSEEDAEAFEAHFFGCERCWGLVQQGLELQAAHESAAPQAVRPYSPRLSASKSSARRALRPHAWWGLAAAAALVLTVVGVDQLGPDREMNLDGDVLRGGAAVFALIPDAKADTLTVAWPKLPEADLYQVRLYALDGTLALQRETVDTTLSVSLESLGAPQPGTEVFWQVQAFDALRNPVAQSELTRAALPDSTP